MRAGEEVPTGGLFKSIQAKFGIQSKSGSADRADTRASTASGPSRREGGERERERQREREEAVTSDRHVVENATASAADTAGTADTTGTAHASTQTDSTVVRPSHGYSVSYGSYNQPLNTLPPTAQQDVFLQKLELCSVVYDFSSAIKQVREKEIKREALQDLVDYVNVGSGKFTEEASPAVVRMISRNLFRELPPRRHGEMGRGDGGHGGGRGGAAAGAGVVASVAGVRAAAAVYRVERYGRQGGQAVREPPVHPQVSQPV